MLSALRCRLCAVAVLLLFSTTAEAQVYPFRNYTVKDGLLTNVILCFEQDQYGKLWMGQGDGINIFDGAVFKRLTIEDGLPGGYINALHRSKFNKAKMFIGSRKGVSLYENGKITNIAFGDSVNERDVFSFYELNENDFYIGTRSSIFKKTGGTVTRIPESYKMGYIINFLKPDRNGPIYIPAQQGLFKFYENNNTFERVPLVYDTITSGIESAVMDSSGTMYFMFNDSRLIIVKQNKVVFNKVLFTTRCQDIIYDNGSIWFATRNGLYRVSALNPDDRTQWKHYTRNEGLFSDEIEKIYKDNEGVLWLATRADGLTRFIPGKYIRFPEASPNLHAVDDKDNHIWGSRHHTIIEFYTTASGDIKNTEYVLTAIPDALNIFRFVIDDKDRLWVSYGFDYKGTGLLCYRIKRNGEHNPSTLIPLPYPLNDRSKFPPPAWLSLKLYKNYLVYSVLGDGVAIVDISDEPRLIAKLDKRNGLTDPAIRSLGFDKSGNLWMGGWERGLFSVPLKDVAQPGVKVRAFTEGSGLSDLAIRAILCDSSNVMYFGTRTGGINRYQNNTFTTYSFASGLQSNQIWDLRLIEKENRLLVATQAGIAQSAVNDFTRFTPLPDVSPDPIANCGVTRDKSLWVLDTRGFTIYPGRYQQAEKRLLSVYIDAVTVNGVTLAPAKEYTLSSSDNNIRVEFSVVDLASDGLRYEFTFSSDEISWQPLGYQRYILLSALRHGDYLLRVRAVDNNGDVVSETGRLAMTITPPLWLSRWFLFALIILVAGGYLYRSYYFKRRQNELLRYINDKERAEKELRRNQELFDIISAGVDDYIIIVTTRGEFVYTSASVSKLINIKNKELPTLFAYIHPEDKRKALRSLANAIAEVSEDRIELRLVFPEWGVRFVEAQWNVIRDEQGNPASVIIVSRDTTERKMIEDKILQLNRDLESKVEIRTAELLSINDSLQLEIIERERKEEIERDRADQLINYRTRLLELAQMDKRNFTVALEQILSVCAHTLCIERAGFWVLDESASQLKCDKMFIRSLDRLYPEAEQTVLPATFPGKGSDSISYLDALAKNKPLIAFNALEDPDSEIVEKYLIPNHISSMVDVPVWYRGKVKGILCVEQVGSQWGPTSEEEDFLTSLATMITLSLETEQRYNAEKQLRNSEEQYRLLVENANESIIVAQDGFVQYANPRTFELIDYTPDELIASPFTAFIHPEDRNLVVQNYIARMKGEATENNYNFRVIQKDGAVRDIEINAVLIYWQGKPATLNFLADITNRKRAENELKKALEKEKELSELRSRFISMASHEFRTPLTSILTSTEILEKFGDKLEEAKKQNNFRRIKDSVRLMTSLLNDVLVIGKSDAGKLELKPAEVDIRAFTGQLIEYVQLSIFAGKENYTFNHSIHGDENSAVFDASLMRQVLENLLVNAVKYSPEGGTVTFTTIIEKNDIIFAVADTGIGIPEEDRERLFEPFHRAKNVGTIAGTGLGLAIVKRAVDLHGGTVTISGGENEGTEFTIRIPRIIASYQGMEPKP